MHRERAEPSVVAEASGRLIGCNVIDPQMEVSKGEDYTLPVAERALVFLKEIGHEAIEFSHGSHWDAKECEAVSRIMDRLGLVPWSLHAWGGGDVMTQDGSEQTSRVLSVAVRNALALRVGRIIYHPSGKCLQGESDYQRLEREAEVVGGVWRSGVHFAFENGGPLATLEYAIALADVLGPSLAGICVDTGHAALGDLGPGRAIRLADHRLITTHLHDNRGERDDHMPPGDGVIDWDDVIRALVDVKYPGCIMLELTDQPSDPARRLAMKDELRRGHEAAKRFSEMITRERHRRES